MSKSISITFNCNHKFIIVYLSCNLNIENFSIFTFTVTFIFSIFSSGKLHYLGYMHNWLNNRSRMIIPHVCWLKVYLLCSRILILWMWSNMCYIEVHDDGFSVAGKPRNFCSSLQRPRIADDASIRAFIRSFQSYSRTDSSNCIVKKFGESWINGRRNDRSFSMAEILRCIVEIFPPSSYSFHQDMSDNLRRRFYRLGLLTLDVLSIRAPIYSAWRALQVPRISENLGRTVTVLFDFTFVHLFSTAAVASGNCELSEREYTVPWLKSILRDPMIKSLAV